MRQAYDYWQDQPDSYRYRDKIERQNRADAPRSTPKKTDRCAQRCGLKLADTAKDPRSSVHAHPRSTAAKPNDQGTTRTGKNQGLHAPTKARQITRCGPTAHRESGDSARQFVKPPYEQDACAIISSRQRLLASDTYTGAPTPSAATKML